MGKFFYIARDAKGNRVTGAEDANTPDELTGRIQAKGLFVVNVMSAETKEAKAASSAERAPRRRRKMHYGVNSQDLTLFCRQLSILLGAGVTILKSLDIIWQQIASRRLQGVIKDLQKNMETGLSLHEAMAKHPKVFSDLWVNLVESGEASGNLAVILNRLATYLERNEAFKRKVVSSLMYPMVLFCAGLGALFFLTLKIIPTFAEMFKGFNMKLPALTQMLVDFSSFLRNYFLFIAVIIILLFFMFRKFVQTRDGRKLYEKFKFNMPVLGDFFRAMVIERFSSEMSTLVESGVPILYSLEISEHSVGNLVMAEIIRDIKESIREGKSLSQPLERSGFFEPMVVQMVSIGEEIGELSQMFKRINSFYQEYAETFLVRLTAMFEPLMLVFMGLVIGVMVVGMFLPIFHLANVGSSVTGG